MSPLAWVLLSAWVLGTWLFTWSLCVMVADPEVES